ncbi:MAG: cation:dicarboxylase symporter family transporter [Coriobacteriia bacterium]|nr:cation:dicarboxylase symporter family transporter [Coriobacteriia bacterium]
MAKLREIKNDEDRNAALDIVKRKIKGLTIPKNSHAYILKLTEILIKRVEELSQNKPISLSVASGIGEKTIKISSPVELPENLDEYCKDDSVIYSTDYMAVKNKNGKGSLTITIKGSATYALLKTFVTVGIGLLFVFLINCFQWSELSGFIFNYITYPIESLFVNALQMIATPVTFFAIICSTSFFYSYLKDGVLGRKLFWRYILSAAVAVVIGGLLFSLIHPFLQQGSMSEYVVNQNVANQTFPDFIANLIPSNIMDPFTSGNSLQLLILAVIIGIAVGALRHKQTFVGKLIDGMNSIFIEVLNIIFVFSPYALFFAVLAIGLGGEAYEFGFLAAMFIAIVIGLIILVLIRCVILLANHISPIWFFKQYKPFFAPVMVTGSTIECIPENIKNCRANFKLPKKYLSQSIPFCAHNNMDGNCLFLGVVCTTIAYICNLEVNLALVGALIMFAIVLSAGAPNQPGSGIICMAVLIPTMGVNSILIIYVVMLDLVCETLIACTNNISDMATVVCEAKREGLLD